MWGYTRGDRARGGARFDGIVARARGRIIVTAYVPLAEMNEIEAFDEDTIEELRKRARAALLTEAIAKEEKVDEAAEDLLTMEGMDDTTAHLLASKGVATMDELAELAVDELVELTGMDAERATALIMTARAPWFK